MLSNDFNSSADRGCVATAVSSNTPWDFYAAEFYRERENP
jgi:hypothetical protein